MNRSRIAAVLTFVTIALAAVFAVANNSDHVAGQPTAEGETPAAVAATPTTTTSRPPDPLDLDDFLVNLRVTEKQCFGSAGCVVTVQPDLTFVHSASELDGRSFDVTFEVTGDASGVVTQTITATGTEVTVTPLILDTTGPGVAPKATVTFVQEY